MPGVFDRLQRQIEDKQSEGGITALDLADLPPALRKIMRLMLRELQLSYGEITQAVASFPEPERLAHQDLDEALEALTRQAWLIRIGDGQKAIYKVNLRRKSGSTLASGVWNALDAKLKDKPE
ncbi:MAG TPA: hypothetical protein VLZ89_00420 [Anaerolineales bacterium]|nr:hypothetical protein [Anaerolineales bacterium]